MLRTLLIYLSKAMWAQNMVSNWSFAWKAASRFIAGEEINDAINVVKVLNARGIFATLDQLGENTSTLTEAQQSTQGIIDILEQIDRNKVKANVSIKLTQIGLALDEEICERNLESILRKARELRNYIRIDMEDSPYTDKTIRLFRALRSKGYLDVGLVVQSCLYRTEKDIRELLCEGTHFRLVKGAYKEPAHIAYPKKADVDSNFDNLTTIMINYAIENDPKEISHDGLIPPVTALGTHDAKRINFAVSYQTSKGLAKKALEIQMLYGIRRDLQEKLANEGYPVRIYVPFGTHWYPYFVRRLAERPANIWFFLSNLFRR
ncbi:MAG: proline dehydrogenase family protein [Chloroflexota bacterium]